MLKSDWYTWKHIITFTLGQLKSLFFTEFKQCYKIIPTWFWWLLSSVLKSFWESNDVQLTKLTNFIQLDTLKMHQISNKVTFLSFLFVLTDFDNFYRYQHVNITEIDIPWKFVLLKWKIDYFITSYFFWFFKCPQPCLIFMNMSLTWKRSQYDWNALFKKCCYFYSNNFEYIFVSGVLSIH